MRFRGLALLLFALAACGERAGVMADGPLDRPLVQQPERLGVGPLSALAPDGLRVSIVPSFGDFAFIVDFMPSSRGCHLVSGEDVSDSGQARPICALVAVRYSIIGRGERPRPPRHHSFLVPEEEFRDLAANFDALAERWRDPGPDLDGTAIGVERYRRGRLRSLASNGVEPGNPAALLGVAVHRMLLAYGPAGTVPRTRGFTISSEPYGPCQPTDFASPDPDGFGAGEDSCARHRAAPPAVGAGGAR